jgi:hypothetical protein
MFSTFKERLSLPSTVAVKCRRTGGRRHQVESLWFEARPMEEMTTAAKILGLSLATGPVVANFLKRVLAPTADAVGKVMAHPIEDWHRRRVERASKLAVDAAVMLDQAGTEPQAVPGRLLWPILERGSLEEDDWLRRRWAALLANAADARGTVAVNPAFVRILADLMPGEVAALEAQWEEIEKVPENYRVFHAPVFQLERGERDRDIVERHLTSLGLLDEVRSYSIDINDVGMRLAEAIKHHSNQPIRDVETQLSHHTLTQFGIRFLMACRPPSSEKPVIELPEEQDGPS